MISLLADTCTDNSTGDTILGFAIFGATITLFAVLLTGWVRTYLRLTEARSQRDALQYHYAMLRSWVDSYAAGPSDD
jgi:hypothetical protein